MLVTSLMAVSIALNFAAGAPVYDSGAVVDNLPVDDYSKIYLPPPITSELESAKLETEGIPSKVISVYDNHQKKVSDIFNPKPLIDTIEEHEKYGNEGDKFYGVGRAIVNGYEAFANFVNKLLTAQSEAKKAISSNITKQLNNLGGKLVGIA